MIPFRIKFEPYVELQGEAEKQRLALNAGRKLAQRRVHTHPVAVVGGGPSLAGSLDELKHWPGDVWAVNYTAQWLAERGIESTLFTVDQNALSVPSVKRGLLASCCHPDVFDSLDAEMFHLIEHDPMGAVGGVTSVTRAPVLALQLGYPGVHFFGCDSSYEDRDHVDRHEAMSSELIVKADGRTFRTQPELLMQAENLALVIKDAPCVFVNRSGGLLEAMVQDDQWEIVAVSGQLKQHLIEINGDCGLFDEPYTGAS